LRLVIVDMFRRVIVDATAPAGTGWTTGRRGSGWRYHGPRISSGVRRAIVQPSRADASAFDFKACVRGAFLGAAPARALRVALVLDPTTAATGECGEGMLPTSRCRLGARTFACTPIPPNQSCPNPDPDALIACDARNAAHAQERYFVANQTYYTGDCGGLPGFIPSPSVRCTTIGNDLLGFVIQTEHPSTTQICIWQSQPAPGTPILECYSGV
jgi:hypothetical protein